jgi:Fe-Mn family superoxide dismutase
MAFELPQLPYDFSALEPHIDAKTMEIHHGKHHNAYVTNLNKAIEGSELEGKSLDELMQNISLQPLFILDRHWPQRRRRTLWRISGSHQ